MWVPGKVVLKLEKYSGTDVRVNNTLNFGLTVEGTTNPAVTLQVNGIPGGNSAIGTAVVNSGRHHHLHSSGRLFPHRAMLFSSPLPASTILRFLSRQNISVMNPIPILTSASPMSFNPGPATIVLTGSRFINGAQVLVNGVPTPTTFDSGTQLTATVNLTQPGNLDLQVLNPSPGPATSADLIALVNGTPPVPIVTPADAARFLEQATFGATDADIHHFRSSAISRGSTSSLPCSRTRPSPMSKCL